VGCRTGLDAVENKTYHCLCRELNTGRLARSLVSIPIELHRFLTMACKVMSIKIPEKDMANFSMISGK
jgi:hypothetical protein